MAVFCFIPEQRLGFPGISAMATLLAGTSLKLLLPAKLFPRKQIDGCKLGEFRGFKNIYVDL